MREAPAGGWVPGSLSICAHGPAGARRAKAYPQHRPAALARTPLALRPSVLAPIRARAPPRSRRQARRSPPRARAAAAPPTARRRPCGPARRARPRARRRRRRAPSGGSARARGWPAGAAPPPPARARRASPRPGAWARGEPLVRGGRGGRGAACDRQPLAGSEPPRVPGHSNLPGEPGQPGRAMFVRQSIPLYATAAVAAA